MRNWVARMEEAGAQVYGGEDAICMNEPDSEAEKKLKKHLAKSYSFIINSNTISVLSLILIFT